MLLRPVGQFGPHAHRFAKKVHVRNDAHDGHPLGERVARRGPPGRVAGGNVDVVRARPQAPHEALPIGDDRRRRLVEKIEADLRAIARLNAIGVIVDLDDEIGALLEMAAAASGEPARRVSRRPSAERSGGKEARTGKLAVARLGRRRIEPSRGT